MEATRGQRDGIGPTGGPLRQGVEFGGAPAPNYTPATAVARASEPLAMSQKTLEERTRWVYDEQTFPVWNSSFDRADRTEMIRDDLWAGRSIAVLLATLVAVGLALALGTLAFVANWR
jgi:hypothetical protein